MSRQSSPTAPDPIQDPASVTSPLPSQSGAYNTSDQDTSMGRQAGSTSLAELKELHYSVMDASPGDLFTLCRPSTPLGYDSQTFGKDVTRRMMMHYDGLQDDELPLSEYSCQQHDDGLTAVNTAVTAARNRGTENPTLDLVHRVLVPIPVFDLSEAISRWSRRDADPGVGSQGENNPERSQCDCTNCSGQGDRETRN